MHVAYQFFNLQALNWQADDLHVSFTNQSSGTPPLEYLWEFGDGATSSEPSPTHQYASIGRYTVQLTITDPCGGANYHAIVGVGKFFFLPLTAKN